MNSIEIKASKDTLGISCDVETGIINMEGISYPQDAAEFFSSIFDWLNKYTNEINSSLTLNLRINYLNTSSTKCLFDLIDSIEEYYKQGGVVQVNWYYLEGDEDIKETGLEFKEDMILPFTMIAF